MDEIINKIYWAKEIYNKNDRMLRLQVRRFNEEKGVFFDKEECFYLMIYRMAVRGRILRYIENRMQELTNKIKTIK